MVQQADSTLAAIKTKVRRLTASPSTSALTEANLEQYINTFYSQDFPYGIKLDQMRNVYTFFTEPNVDYYPLDVNYDQGVREPFYVDGIQGYFYKDRHQFFNMFPRWPTLFQQGTNTLTGIITGITNSVGAQITSANHNLTGGAVVTIENVVGMVQLNGNAYEVLSIVDANNFIISVDSTAFGTYVSGGTWTASNSTFSFMLSGGTPFLATQVTIGGTDQSGNPINIGDDGNGNLQYVVTNAQVSIPADNIFPAVPGMYNLNTQNPGLQNKVNIGSVNYVTGQFNFTLPDGIELQPGTIFKIFISQYTTGRPYAMLFWNNYFIIRPVPKLVHKIEVETYLTPVQFMSSTDNPILNQWWQYIAYGVAREILRDRQDMEGVANMEEGFKRQEGLVLERQGVEEINQRNTTVFASTVMQQGWNQTGGFPY